ncbi:TIGR02687 family protein [Alkalibacterium subtropicum]|uniref:TIGR02687 family protein n=1 Tax=Alkalibacterium subtropicum TaxID=753702 RepID=A0A1I1L286_9LACT|nr:BREX-1 system phosphatase PglZ type A [Alkalibacterium subtropicum]SFC67154.1 TIGR02687 family protein [Alkalibacterium subtropicum]
MAEELLSRIETYYDAPLKDGEKRKILYLFDPEEAYADTIKTWAEETDAVELLTVTTHNFFQTNYLIEKELKDTHLFLYFAMERPRMEDNPLLDVLLYSEELKVDALSQLYLTLGIDPDNEEVTSVIKEYPVFFRAKNRISQFKRLYNESPYHSAEVVDYAVFAALTKAQAATWMAVLIELFEEAASKENSKWDQLVKFGDEKQFWSMIDQLLGYNKDTSMNGSLSVDELMHQVFLTYLGTELGQSMPKELKPYMLEKSNPIVIFINQWMNTKNKESAFYFVSTVVESAWDFDHLLHDLPSETLTECETFKWFDHELIDRFVQSIQMHVSDSDRLLPLLAKRRNTIWFDHFQNSYIFLKWAIQLNHYTESFEADWQGMAEPRELWQYYSDQGYHVDTAYRKMTEYYDDLEPDQKDTVRPVKDQMERLYVNQYLNDFTKKWDLYFKNSHTFDSNKLQANFFDKEVKPYLANDRRIVVIISDGLRYEAGKELYQELTKEKRFNGEIDWMQTELPSITSVGMASLLPHHSLEFQTDGTVLVDEMKTIGLANREAILKKNGHPEALALKATDIDQMTKDQLREKMAGKKLVYVYHNKVDAIGDHLPTENDVFKATRDSINDLIQLMNRLTGDVSIGAFLVTADHGYLYTRSAISSSDKVSVKNNLDAWVRNKRFILSEKEEDHYSGLSFTLSERLDNTGYITVPRGMNRFALKGGGYQYSHGGHLPQEMMVPLLRIKTDRSRNEIPEVDVSLISQTRKLTNNIVWLSFLQTEPVSEQKKEKRLNLYFEDEKGRKISNELTLIADRENKASDERVYTEKFVLLNESYSSLDTHYFVMENANDEEDTVKERFKLDLIG